MRGPGFFFAFTVVFLVMLVLILFVLPNIFHEPSEFYHGMYWGLLIQTVSVEVVWVVMVIREKRKGR